MNKSITMSRRRFVEAGGLAGVLASLAACGGTSSSGSGSSEGDAASADTLTIVIAEEPTGLDIQQVEGDNQVHQLIYEPLVGYTADLSEVVPFFAEAFEQSEDGLTLTFTLPADAKFSNGNPCDAAACVASFERYLEISPYSTDYEDVESVEVIDDVTWAMHLSGPAPYMYAALTSLYAAPIDAAVAAEMSPDDFSRAPISTGAYYVESWDQGSQVTLRRNEHYRTNNPAVANKEAPAFETIVIRFIQDDFTRVSELEDGEAALAFAIPDASVADLEANPDVTTYTYAQAGCSYLDINTDDPLMADAAVREAIAYAINREELADALDGNISPLYGLISPAMSCFSAEEEAKLAQQYACDPDHARQVLADAGWEDADGDGIVEKDGQPLSFELLVPSDYPSNTAVSPIIQQQLAAVGIDMQIREYESGYILDIQYERDFQMAWIEYDWNDPDLLLVGLLGTPAEMPWYGMETVDEMLFPARVMTDANERTAAYAEFQDWVSAQFKAIPVFYKDYVVASEAALEGMAIAADGRFWLNDATVA